MLNIIWLSMIFIAVIVGAIEGRIGQVVYSRDRFCEIRF